MQVSNQGAIVREISVKLNPGKNSGPFAVIQLGPTAIYVESIADCDELKAAEAEARRLLLGEDAPPAGEPMWPAGGPNMCEDQHPNRPQWRCQRPTGHHGGHKSFAYGEYWPAAPAVTSPVPVRAEQVVPGGYTLPAGVLDDDDTWREATNGPPADLTDGRGACTCPAWSQNPPDEEGNALLCWRKTGHDGRHYDGAGKRWWGEDEPEPRCEADFSGAGSPQCLKAQGHEGPHMDETSRRWVFGAQPAGTDAS